MRHSIYLLLFSILSVSLLSCDEPTSRMSGYAVHGIDVSHYQRHIDWKQIAAQDIDFVFVKASEGETYQDSFFQKNWDSIRVSGMKRGAYHFFYPHLNAEKQANNFIQAVQLHTGDLPPVLDFETTANTKPDSIISNLRTWLQIVEKQYGKRPIIYTTPRLYAAYIEDNFQNYPLWIAKYNKTEPLLRKGKLWHFWQYGDSGQVEGIDGKVDLNVFQGSLVELDEFCSNYVDTP